MRLTSWARKFVAVVFSAFVVVASAVAETSSAACEGECVVIGQWQLSVGVGLGLRTNPLHDGEDAPLIVLPELSYYGEHFFLRNLEFGYTLLESDRHQLHALVTPSSDQMYFNRWDPLNVFELGGVANTAAAPSLSTALVPDLSSTYAVTVELSPSAGDTAEGRPPAPQLLQIEGADNVYVNGSELSLEAGLYTVLGRAGNRISLDVGYGSISVTGLSTMDELQVTGENARFADATDANGIQAGQWPQVSVSATEPAPGAREVSSRAVRERKLGGLAGLEYMYSRERFALHLQALNEFTGLHGGHELRIAGIFPWSWAEQRWALTLGVNYQSREVLNYYYGLEEGETDSGAVYSPVSGGLTKMVRLDWQKPLSERWSLRALVQYKLFAGEIASSPLAASDNSTAIFFGGVYHF